MIFCAFFVFCRCVEGFITPSGASAAVYECNTNLQWDGFIGCQSMLQVEPCTLCICILCFDNQMHVLSSLLKYRVQYSTVVS